MVLVTGATGMVGGNLLWHLLQTEQKIRAIRRSEHSADKLCKVFGFYCTKPDDYLSRIEWVYADVLDRSTLDVAMQGVDIVYHCAAVVDLGKNSAALTDTNVRGTRNVVAAALAAKVKSFCFVSSIAACGSTTDNSPVDENSTFNRTAQRSLYSASKFFSEKEVWVGISQGLPGVIVNPGVILGVSGNNAGSARLFSQVQKGMPFYTLGGTGYVDVRDVVQIMIKLTESNIKGERYILVSENCCNRDILSMIAGGVGKKPPFINAGKFLLYVAAFMSAWIGKLTGTPPAIDRQTARTALGRSYYSSKKITTLLNYTFIPVEQSIAEICSYLATKNPDRK